MSAYRSLVSALVLGLAVSLGSAAVDVTAPAPQVSKTGDVTRTIQKVTIANELAYYTLTYDYDTRPDRPGEAGSTWWGWSIGFIPLGMNEPCTNNWYWQACVSWTIGDEDLSKRPATFRVVRPGGADGMVEYAWDTPKVKASLRLALTTGHDKLLVFGSYEPKVPLQGSVLRFSSYPGGFEMPHNRAVTTVLGTHQAGETVQLDLAREKWALLEDTTPNLPRAGSAGMLIGTPESFASGVIPVGDYGIVPEFKLKPEARRFAVALYSFPGLPDYQATREYFRKSADGEAAALGKMAAGNLDEPLPPIAVDPSRFAGFREQAEKLFARGVESWRPNPAPLAFDWAKKLAGGPIRASLFTGRWQAWETMELARRLDLQVSHLYWDGPGFLTSGDYWPYAGTTGQGALPTYLASQRAVELVTNDQAEVFMVASVSPQAIPSGARTELLRRVAAGTGLFLADTPGRVSAWPAELFKNPDAAATASVLAGLDWANLPGYRGAKEAPAAVYRYGEGRVVVLRLNPTTYGCLVPQNDQTDGLGGLLDRALALAGRCALTAAGRVLPCQARLAPAGATSSALGVGLPAGSTLVMRVQDDLDNVLTQQTLKLPLANPLPIPTLPAMRAHWVDLKIQDAQGNCLGYAFTQLPAGTRPGLAQLQVKPALQRGEALTPRVDLPRGGAITCAATVSGLTAAAESVWEVRDAFGRLEGRKVVPVPRGSGPLAATLTLPRPVAVCHTLDVALRQGTQVLARQRLRFTMTVPYPYDDFTGLMWSYAGGDPVLRLTDRQCYEWGADMMDLCHVGGMAGERGAREFWLSSASGLRIIPYVQRLAGRATDQGFREPCLHDPKYLDSARQGLVTSCAQAEPFGPAAYTLGDENYMLEGAGEACASPETMVAFQQWLRDKYQTLAALNAAWNTNLPDFGAVTAPMLIAEAAAQPVSFAPWLDHKLFMDSAFAGTHETFMNNIREVDPAAKVGWDGFLGYHWRAGYDFGKLTANLQLNQTYTADWLQGELVRSLKRPDALTGKWGNSDADVEAGWHAFPWDGLLNDDNSVWWWTSWGCDYIPFNPDGSQSQFGKWFFEALRETTQGPGKLLLHADRMDSGIGVLYDQRNLFAGAVQAEMKSGLAASGDGGYLSELTCFLQGLRDYGVQYHCFTPAQLAREADPARNKLLLLPLAMCLSDAEAALLRGYVERGGTLLVDGRCGLLTGDGAFRATRPLDEVLGLQSPAGREAFIAATKQADMPLAGALPGVAGEVPLAAEKLAAAVLEPGIKATTAKAVAQNQPAVLVNRFGQGRAITLNFALTGADTGRTKPGLEPIEQVLAAALQAAGIAPFCELKTPAGARPRCVQQIYYRQGAAAYLALMRDFRTRGLDAEQVHVTLPAAATVYDLRAGKKLGQLREWDVKLDRGYPAVYALLPYEVQSLKPQAPASASPSNVPVSVQVAVSAGKPADHVVRLDVFAPGSQAPHRQYSQNVLCPAGRGQADLPFAVSDAKGAWRLIWRDVASGVSATGTVKLK